MHNSLLEALIPLVLFVIFGILFINRRFVEWFIRLENKLRGLETKEIPELTFKVNRIAGIGLIILGIALGLLFYFE